MILQKTINSTVYARGIGLHSGKYVTVCMHPAPVDTGVLFRYQNGRKTIQIAASAPQVVDTGFATTIGNSEARVSTVEHLMATFSALGVDNVVVDVDGQELPILDGSASYWVFLIQSAGLRLQNSLKKFIKINQPLEVVGKDMESWVKLEPGDGFSLEFQIVYDHPVFRDSCSQPSHIDFSKSTFITEISRARTYGFMSDYDRLRELNLVKGCSFENAIILDDNSIVNGEQLRYPDEFARHKILDAIGDLYILGHNLLGNYRAHKAGHSLNQALVSALVDSPKAWEYVTFEDRNMIPSSYQEALEEQTNFVT